jgi:hypothetical protein
VERLTAILGGDAAERPVVELPFDGAALPMPEQPV